MPSDCYTVRVIVSGRVQGVYYRGWTVGEASAIGVDGWVCNRPDGTVEAVFSGRRQAVERMLTLARQGPPQAVVETIEVNQEDKAPPVGFRQIASG